MTPDSVAALRIERGRRAVSLARVEGRWRVGNAPADSAAVARVLGALSDLAAAGFASDSEATALDFARPDRRLLVMNSRGDTLLALPWPPARPAPPARGSRRSGLGLVGSTTDPRGSSCPTPTSPWPAWTRAGHRRP